MKSDKMNDSDGMCILDPSKTCDGCLECRCVLDPEKVCDNCFKCLEPTSDYASIQIDGIITEPGATTMRGGVGLGKKPKKNGGK